MSLLIKGMEMPKNCCECPCSCSWDPWTKPTICRALDKEPEISDTGRLSECPLVEIPTPHGRLIDADRLIAVLKSTTAISQIDYDLFNHIVGLIEHQPNVIEKE